MRRIVKMNFRDRCGSSRVEVHARTMLQNRRARQKQHSGINPPRAAQMPRSGQYHAAVNFLMIDSRKINRSALSSRGAPHGFSARLHAARPQPLAARKKLQFVFDTDTARDQCSSNNGAKSFHRKRSVNRQTGEAADAAPRNTFCSAM